MKKLLFKSACALLAAVLAIGLAGCSGKTESSAPSTEAATESVTTEPPTEAEVFVTETDLTKLHPITAQSDQFAGMWHITDGVGAKLEHFVYEFDGNGNAYIMVGTTGYCGTYGVKAEDGKDLFITQLMFGLDGKYTYEFSKDRNSVVLTNISNESTTTLEKTEGFSPVPDATESYVTDEALLGAWVDSTGGYLYFGKDGVMYDAQANVSFTFYTYSAADGKINETSVLTEEINETATYSVEKDVQDAKKDILTYNDVEYQRVSADKLP